MKSLNKRAGKEHLRHPPGPEGPTMRLRSGYLRVLDEVSLKAFQGLFLRGMQPDRHCAWPAEDDALPDVDDGHAIWLRLAKGDVAAVAEPVGGRGECLGPQPQG